MHTQKPAPSESPGESISRFLRDGFQKYTAFVVEITWKRFWLLAFLTLVAGSILDDILPSKRSPELEAAVQIFSQVVAAGKERSGEIPWARLEIPTSVGTNLAWILVIGSTVIKLSARGRVEAEAAATAATETAERESLKRQVAEARMATMEAQVEPHFLFNTLASIDHLIETDPATASRMQKHFIAFLRATLPSLRNTAPSSLQPLGRELEIIEPYLELFRIRMGKRGTGFLCRRAVDTEAFLGDRFLHEDREVVGGGGGSGGVLSLCDAGRREAVRVRGPRKGEVRRDAAGV
jgi:hypothetical protein